MLFQNTPPLFLKHIDSNQIVLCTKFRIIFTFIDKPQHHFFSILVQKNPRTLHYSHQRKQAFVVTQKSIEVYTCDFSHQVTLKKVVILNQETVLSVLKGNPKEWEVFGEIYQYSTQNLKIHSIEQRSLDEEAASFCFIQQFEVYLNKGKKLLIYDHKKQSEHEVKWNEDAEQILIYLKNLKANQLKLKGFKINASKFNHKPLTASIKESKSELLSPQRSESQKRLIGGLSGSKWFTSELYSSAAGIQEHSRMMNQITELGLFFLILEIQSKFVIALAPPEHEHNFNQRKQSAVLSQKNSIKADSRTFEEVKVSPLETKWHIKKLSVENSLQQEIFYSSTYRHFRHPSFVTAQQMIRKNQLTQKQGIQEVQENEMVWMLSKMQNSVIFSLIKPQNVDFSSQNEVMNSGISENLFNKTVSKQNFMINRSQLMESNENNLEKEFYDMLYSFNTAQNQNQSQKPILELIDLDSRNKSIIGLTFLYYIPETKGKNFSSIKLKATRIPYQNSKGLEFSTKNTKSTTLKNSQNLVESKQNYVQKGQKITNPGSPTSFHNSGLSSSQSLSNLTPVSGSQQINLTYSDDTDLNSYHLSRLPSLKSQKQSTPELQKRPQNQTISQKYRTTDLISSSESVNNPLKQSRNRTGLYSNSPTKISAQTKSFMDTIAQVTETSVNPSRTSPIPIKQVSEEHLNDESCSKLEEDSQVQIVEEIMQVADFKPSSQNKSFGAVRHNNSSRDQSQKSSKVVEKIQFDIPNIQNRVMKKSSLQTYKKGFENQKLIEPMSSKYNKSSKKANKHQRLDISLSNETQEKQFYQKLIDHFNANKELQHDGTFFALKDSRESSARQFRTSKVSCDDFTKKQKMQNMIGKDISEIVNGKNLRESQDDEPYCSEEETVELGEEIEKEYSRSLIKKGIKEEPAGQGLFSKHNTSISCSEPTVILLDKLDDSGENLEKTNSQFEFNSMNSQNDMNYPKTPVFNVDFHNFDNSNLFKQPQIGIVSDDHWENFNKKWNMTTEMKYNQNEEFNMKNSKVSLKGNNFMRDSKNNYVTKNELEKLSKKVKAFCNDTDKLTWDEARQIQAKKITQLMREMFVKSEEKFNALMKEFLSEIIREEEARLFFAEYIRTFSGKTRDILVRLYMSLPDNEQNKKWMSKALSEFKLAEVPQICLPIAKDILQIFKYLYPSVFIEDLLKPSIPLYQKLLENYFDLERLPVEQIMIEDEAIDLSHPRNMLNILLFLNENFSMPMGQVFEVYCSELIKHDCAQIVVKMLKQEQTFDICEVSKTILQDIVENTIIEKIKECSTNIQWIGKSLQILECNISATAGKKRVQLSILLNVIDALNLSDCIFSIDTLFKLSQIKNLFVFCNTLIRQNTVTNLKKLNFPFMYRELHEIAYEQKLKYYNQELKDLIEILCQKYFQNHEYRTAFQIIAPVIQMTKRGFIAKMLFKYMEGKMMNRLSNKTFTLKGEFQAVFKEFFVSPNQSQKSSKSPPINHDKFNFDSEKSYLLNCPYFKFFVIYNDCVQSTKCEEVIHICYTDYQLASELATYHVIQKKEWQDLSESLNEYVPKEEIKKLVAKSVFKFNSRIRISEGEDDQDHIEPSSSFALKQIEALHATVPKKQDNKYIKSLQAIELKQTANGESHPKKLNVHRSKSDNKMPWQSPKRHSLSDPIIQSLKYEVNPESVRQTLRKLYYNEASYSRTKDFLKALGIVDRQRLKICHYEKFKTVIGLDLDFEVEKLLPFEIFFTQDYDKCYQLIKQNQLLKKLSIKNFWTVYIIMEILFSRGQQIAILMIQKLVSQFKSQDLGQIVNQILDKCRVSQQNLKLLVVRAQMEGQIEVSRKIKQRILNKSN